MCAPLLQVLAFEKVTKWPRMVLQAVILLFLNSPRVTHRTSGDCFLHDAVTHRTSGDCFLHDAVTHRTSGDCFLHDALTAFSRCHVRAAHFSPDQCISASVHLTAADEALNSSARN
jgi:hypothetical protein